MKDIREAALLMKSRDELGGIHVKKDFCCDKMGYFARNHCDRHASIFECPDCLVFYDENDDSYGIIVHDGGESFIKIGFCPWCGTNLRN